jgi:hypothetical protein
MSAESNKSRGTLADQLASLDDRLNSAAADVEMLADIQEGIGSMLSSNDISEAEIRRVLQERYESGGLRKETFQLVKSMLDRYVSERIPTSPTTTRSLPSQPAPPQAPEPPAAAPMASDEDSFGATTVIPTGAVPINDADSRVQVGSILRDRFLLKQKVSGGSMGVVYKALDRRLAEAGSEQPHVAIKVLSPQLAEDGHALRALQQEAAKTRCLVHPNIVRFVDLDRDDDLYFLILEWLEGRTLADILDTSDARSIDTQAAFRIVRQVGGALEYAHKCGIVHADVKPGNIMIMPNGDAKLFDFGVARVRQKQAASDFDPGVLGALTPAYSSMQVLGGEEPAAQDDVFSLGCLMYRLVAGYRVFGPRNAAEASQAGMTPQKPQSLPDEHWPALKKALSYPRVTRFKSVREFLDALGEHKETNPVNVKDTTLIVEPPERFASDDGGSPGKWVAIFVVLLGLGGIGAKQMGYLDPWIAELTGETVEVAAPIVEPVATEVPAEPLVEEPAPEADEPATDVVTNEPEAVDTAVEVAEDAIADEAEAEPPAAVVPREPLVDFSKLPPPTVIVSVAAEGVPPSTTPVILREDGDAVIVDFVRGDDLSLPLTLRLEEVGFTGNTSPWANGQYALSNAGLLNFPIGQERARITIRPADDPRREPDQQSTLRLRPVDAPEIELATVNVTLEDDDRRAFENRLPSNTLGFSQSQVSVNEADPAVQVDVMRFNPDDTAIVVNFSVEDLTATEGEDYFAPGSYTISFAPGQHTARLLIPLVQDLRAEGDEAFVIKLNVDPETQPVNVTPNVAVMIRDDE